MGSEMCIRDSSIVGFGRLGPTPCFIAILRITFRNIFSFRGATTLALVDASLPMRRLLALAKSTRRRVDVVETLEIVGDVRVLLYVVPFVVDVMPYMMSGLGHDRAMIMMAVIAALST